MNNESKEILNGQHKSYWIDTTPVSSYSPMDMETNADVAIAGGGIAGIVTAFMLQRRGFKVVLLEMNRILEGVTGHTTAKLTSGHGIVYKHLIKEFGKEKAQIYADANQSAIEWVDNTAKELHIDAEFSRIANYVYTTMEDKVSGIHDEVDAASKLNLPVSFISETTDLPFEIKGSVRYNNQAIFHPRKFLLGLAKEFVSNGGSIYEHTRALKMNGSGDGGLPSFETNKGTVWAKDLVIATNFPFVSEGLFIARLLPKKSYVVAVHMNDKVPEGMYYEEDPYHTIRPHKSGDENIVLIGGKHHRAGHVHDSVDNYLAVRDFAINHFPVSSIDYWWSTHDSDSLDRLPYIGKLAADSKHEYVITGFGGWGMTQGIISGMIITDLIGEKHNDWADLYDPSRFKFTAYAAKKFLELNIPGTKHVIKSFIVSPPKPDFDSLKTNDGKVFKIGEKDTAVYRDENGSLHGVSSACSHMGCTLNWDKAEHSWDCPCHGSRFSCDGAVLHGPAVSDLEKIDVKG